MALQFEDLKERLKSEWEKSISKLNESPLFNQIKDRYQSLNANVQKAINAIAIILAILLFIYLPYSNFSSSIDSIESFESKRNLIRETFKISQELNNQVNISQASPIQSLKNKIESELESNQILPEQIKNVNIDSIPNYLPKEQVDGALTVSLGLLNLRQIVDIGYVIQSLEQAIKMTDIKIESNLHDPRYFDVEYKIVTLRVPDISLPIPEPEEKPKNKKLGSSKEKSKDQEDE